MFCIQIYYCMIKKNALLYILRLKPFPQMPVNFMVLQSLWKIRLKSCLSFAKKRGQIIKKMSHLNFEKPTWSEYHICTQMWLLTTKTSNAFIIILKLEFTGSKKQYIFHKVFLKFKVCSITKTLDTKHTKKIKRSSIVFSWSRVHSHLRNDQSRVEYKITSSYSELHDLIK